MMKVAVVQLHAGQDKTRNIAKAVYFTKAAIRNKARFILLPEVFNYRGRSDRLRLVAEKIPGDSLTPFIVLAKKHKVFILAGSVCEKLPGQSKVYNTSVLINPAGKIAAKYRKIHLFEAVIKNCVVKESESFLSGNKLAVTQIEEFKVGLSICYDVRFPEFYRNYFKRRGVQVLCVPSAFTKTTGQAHWETLLRARAIENLCYVLAPNQVGRDNRGIETFGHSLIVDPWGKILAKADGKKEGNFYAKIDLVQVKKARAALPAI